MRREAVNIEPLLEKVQKPGRYAGGELNSAQKDLSDVRVRFALCFPDLYEIGMSHLGSKILYGLLCFCSVSFYFRKFMRFCNLFTKNLKLRIKHVVARQ